MATDRHKHNPKSVRIPGGLLAWLKEQAVREGRTANAIIIAAIEEYRARHSDDTQGMADSADPLSDAREIMKRQAREAGQSITERWHNHPSLDPCGPACPGQGTDWDGKGLVIDRFA